MIRTGKLLNSELKSVIEEFRNQTEKFKSASIGNINRSSYNPDVRKSEVYFPKILDCPKTFNIIQSLIIQEYAHIQVDISDIPELQFASYTIGGHFTKHKDMIGTNRDGKDRGFTISVNLTNPSEYDGGNLIVYTKNDQIVLNREKGSFILFPAFLSHEVTMITRGKRDVVVGWYHLPIQIIRKIGSKY